VRLELQYALALLKLGNVAEIRAPKSKGGAVDLERGPVKLSLHISNALKLCREGDFSGCASELYAADALISKVIPRLKKESKR